MVQTRNAFNVVETVRGRPVLVESFDSEKAALRRCGELARIKMDVYAQQDGLKIEDIRVETKTNEKCRGAVTSCSGLPVITFPDYAASVAVVRGPVYERRGPSKSIPFVAVVLDYDLNVVSFEDPADAEAMYETIRAKHINGKTFQEKKSDDQVGFTMDGSEGPSVILGTAPLMRRGTPWKLV